LLSVTLTTVSGNIHVLSFLVIIALFKNYNGKLVDIGMESGEFAAYIDLQPSKGPKQSVRGITKEFGDGICWYLDKKTIQHFYTNMSQFFVNVL
jgi:hypothetical protein